MNEQHNRPSRAKIHPIVPWLICGLGALFYIYEYVLRIIPAVITNNLMTYFGINALVVSNLAAFYYYAYTPMQLPVGVLMDRFGPRRLLTFACLCCALGSYLFAGTALLSVASIGRFLVGFGSAFAFVGVLKLATIWLPPNRFGMMSGLASSLGAIGAAIGVVSLQRLVDQFNWRNTVLLTAVSGVILAVILLVFIRDSSEEKGYEKTTIHWNDVKEGFKIVIRNKFIWINGLVGCLFYFPASVFAELWGKQYLVVAHGFDHDNAAVGISMVFLGFALGGPLFGLMSDILRNRRMPMLVGGLFAAVLFCIILFVPGLSQAAIFTLLFLFGVSYGAQVIVFAISRELSPLYVAATAIAVTNMCVMVSGLIFEPVLGALLELSWGHTITNGLHVYSAANFTQALLIIPIALVVGICMLFFIKETHGDVYIDKRSRQKIQEMDKAITEENYL